MQGLFVWVARQAQAAVVQAAGEGEPSHSLFIDFWARQADGVGLIGWKTKNQLRWRGNATLPTYLTLVFPWFWRIRLQPFRPLTYPTPFLESCICESRGFLSLKTFQRVIQKVCVMSAAELWCPSWLDRFCDLDPATMSVKPSRGCDHLIFLLISTMSIVTNSLLQKRYSP